MIRFMALLLSFLFLGSAFATEQQLKSIVEMPEAGSNEQGPSLVYYDAVCNDPHECGVATIGCSSGPGWVNAVLGGLTQKDIAAWFAVSDGIVKLTVDRAKFDLHTVEISFGDMNGDWWVSASASGDTVRSIWTALRKAKNISIAIGKMVTVLPATDEMTKIAQACVPLQPDIRAQLKDGIAALERKDYVMALKLLKPLAEGGNAVAQYKLGFIYASDEIGGPADYVEALKWWQLAAARGNVASVNERDKVSKQMTPDQIAEAQRLVRSWQGAHSSQ